VLNVMLEYKKTVNSRRMFSSPKVDDAPIGPSVIRHRLYRLFGHAGCREVRFYDLKRGFAANTLAHEMNVKMLSTIWNHTSSNTASNIYAHTTDTVRKAAAEKTCCGIAKAEPEQDTKSGVERAAAFQPAKRQKAQVGDREFGPMRPQPLARLFLQGMAGRDGTV